MASSSSTTPRRRRPLPPVPGGAKAFGSAPSSVVSSPIISISTSSPPRASSASAPVSAVSPPLPAISTTSLLSATSVSSPLSATSTAFSVRTPTSCPPSAFKQASSPGSAFPPRSHTAGKSLPSSPSSFRISLTSPTITLHSPASRHLFSPMAWMQSQECLKEEKVRTPNSSRSTDLLVSEWDSDTEDESGDEAEAEAEAAAESDEAEDDPRGPRWTWTPSAPKAVREAAELSLSDEWGKEVIFGDLLPKPNSRVRGGLPPVRRLVTFFIGHWWCGLCHDYALMSLARLSKAVLEREGVRVVIISSGSWKAISKFRRRFNIPFPAYVDRSTQLYAALGMRTAFPNPFMEGGPNRPKYHRHGLARQMVTGMATGMKMTSMKSPGSFMQLGGEFVFGMGYKCEFAHRMQGRGDHREAPDVLSAVGVKSEAQPVEIQFVPVREKSMSMPMSRRAAPPIKPDLWIHDVYGTQVAAHSSPVQDKLRSPISTSSPTWSPTSPSRNGVTRSTSKRTRTVGGTQLSTLAEIPLAPTRPQPPPKLLSLKRISLKQTDVGM